MCLNNVFVPDKYKHSHGNFYPCGRCTSCQEAKALSRASLINHTNIPNSKLYFVTLTYGNNFIPYVRKSDLLSLVSKFGNSSFFSVPIYRADGKGKGKFKEREIDTHRIFRVFTRKDVESLQGITLEYKNNIRTVDNDRVSVFYYRDIQLFLKRFRINLNRTYDGQFKVAFYSAPEYGPTGQRFHIHFLFWIDERLNVEQVRSVIRKTWSYCDYDSFKDEKWCDYAVAPQAYVSSYSNCSADVSKFLLREFPLKHTHSNNFGFDNDSFQLFNIIKEYRKGNFKYNAVHVNKNGEVKVNCLFYPRRVINRYFPIPKGFNRLRSDVAYDLLRNVTKYYYFTPRSIQKVTWSKVTNSFVNYYNFGIYTVYNTPLLFQKNELKYFASRVLSVYYSFWQPLGYSYENYCLMILSFHRALASARYRDSVEKLSYEDSCLQFSNIRHLSEGKVHNLTFDAFMKQFKGVYDENNLPYVVNRDYELVSLFNTNIKRRKMAIV